MFQNLGENQIKEIMTAAKFSVFFIDEDQRVTLKDIGNKNEIKKWADQLGVEVRTIELESQFRCNGNDGYLAWLNYALGVKQTANFNLENIDYHFRVFDNPCELRDEIFKLNKANNSARMVAGYCWNWASKKAPAKMDITIPQFNFEAQWNLVKDGSSWLINPDTVEEIGCIHTCQGLELDYIGVIIGPDFVVRDGQIITDYTKRDSKDKTIQGMKKLAKNNKAEAMQKAAEIIKNTYRTLLTRGQKGAFLYCTDPETNQYFKDIMGNKQNIELPETEEVVLPFELLTGIEVKPFMNAVPIFDIKVAAGNFSGFQTVSDFSWVKLPDEFVVKEGLFVLQVVGESMNKRIPDGSWCLFKANPGGTRNGKIVLVEHRNITDPDNGGHYTIKRYASTKSNQEEDSWEHKSITLSPESTDQKFKPIELTPENHEEYKVIGEFIAVIF